MLGPRRVVEGVPGDGLEATNEFAGAVFVGGEVGQVDERGLIEQNERVPPANLGSLQEVLYGIFVGQEISKMRSI